MPRQCRNFLFRRKSKRGQAAVADHAPQHFVGNFLICHAGNSRLEQMFPQKGNVHFVIPVIVVIVRQIAQAQAVPVDENNVRPDRKRHNRLAPDPRNLRNLYIVRSQRRRRRHHVDIKFRRPRADKQNVPGINPFPLVKFGVEHRHRNRRFRRCLAAFHIGKVVIVARIRQADVRPGFGIDQKRKPVAEKSAGFRIFRSFVQHAEFPAYRAGLNGVRQARYRRPLYMLFVDNLRNLDNSRPVVQIFPQNAAVGTRPFAVHRFDASGLVAVDGFVIFFVRNAYSPLKSDFSRLPGGRVVVKNPQPHQPAHIRLAENVAGCRKLDFPFQLVGRNADVRRVHAQKRAVSNLQLFQYPSGV